MDVRLPGTALIFTYRRLNRFFHAVSERSFQGPKVYCSSWPNLESISLHDRFYHYYERSGNGTSPLSNEDYVQIITRCRVLRLLPWHRACQMVNAMYAAIDELTDEVCPQYLFAGTTDCYIGDLLARVCRSKGARLIMVCCGSFPNTILLTNYGEFNYVRTPSRDEVLQAVAQLANDNATVTYGGNIRPYSFQSHVVNCAKWWGKCLYFKTRSLVTGDNLNFWCLLKSLRKGDGQSSLANFLCTRFFDADWEQQVRQSGRPPIFIPLSHTPECSTDYWLQDLRYISYESFILEAVRALSKTHRVVIKEHWSVLGQRDWHFYEQLKSSADTILVPPEVRSRKVMGLVGQVMVGAGTTGPEAAIRGKKVVTMDRPYYHLDGFYLNLGNPDGLVQLPQRLAEFQSPDLTAENRQAIVNRMLQATLRGSLIVDEHLNSEENVSTASASLRCYLSAA